MLPQPFKNSKASTSRSSRASTSTDRTSEGTNRNRSNSIPMDYKCYMCPGCTAFFDCSSRSNQYTGKVPLILNCQHTVCQECVSKAALKGSITCPKCKKDSQLPKKLFVDNIQELFPPNFYLIGVILWTKLHNSMPKHIGLVPANVTLRKRTIMEPQEVLPTEMDISSETCCFPSCDKAATMRCPDCNDHYCSYCCGIVHKSAKSLWSHKPVQITSDDFSFSLEKCSEHDGMDMEFFCKICEMGACCYCFLLKHEGHERDYLSKMCDMESAELQMLKEKAEKTFKQLLITHKKVKQMPDSNSTAIEMDICSYFANVHAQLYCIERKLREEVSGIKNGNQALTQINSQLVKSIDNLKKVLKAAELDTAKKINVRALLEKLREAEDIPCYLVSENNSMDSIRFVVNPTFENMEDFFEIERSDENDYKLATLEELPEDYEFDRDVQYETDADSILNAILHPIRQEEQQKKKPEKPVPVSPTASVSSRFSSASTYRKPHNQKFSLDNEKVIVTHIQSLDCFYVQLKKLQGKIFNLDKEIQNYIKIGASTVDYPQQNQLYVCLYSTKNERQWCRGRITEIVRGDKQFFYEVFFVDYGTTQTVTLDKLRMITPGLSHRKPFAIECRLYNPSDVSWHKNAHVHLGKVINRKEVFMVVKNVEHGIHEVDLMVSGTDGSLTSVIDILIHTCANVLSSSDESTAHSVKRNVHVQQLKLYTNSTKFKKNDTMEVVVASVMDPHNIFIHMGKHSESFKNLEHNLKEHYKNTENGGCIPVEGTYAVVEYKDPLRGNWHRVFIKNVDATVDHTEVLLVDWGLTVTVSWSSVRVLVEEFTKMECQSIHVKLAQVVPFNKESSWAENASQYLYKYVRTKEPLKMIVHSVEPLEVALFEMYGSVDLCVNAMLVRDKLADSTGKISMQVEWPQQNASRKDDDGFVANMLKKLNESEDDDEDGEPQAGVKQQIQVVKVVSPDLIHIKFLFTKETEQTLYKELQAHYAKEQTKKDSWTESDECVVRLRETNEYARAILKGIVEGKYRVAMFDKAEEAIVDKDDIFEYATYFRKYPNMTFKCYLADIKPAGDTGKWSNTAIEVLEQTFDAQKQIYVTKVPGDPTKKSIPVQMWYMQVTVKDALEPSEVKYVSINNMLIKLGLAFKQQYKSESSVDKLLPLSTLTITPPPPSEVKLEEKEDANVPTNWIELVEAEEEEQKKAKATEDQKVSPYHTKKAKIDGWLPPFTLKKRRFDAWITFADNDGTLFIHAADLHPLYKDMEAHMKTYFDSNPPSSKKEKWSCGDMCTIAYNNYWYRGIIMESDEAKEKIKAVMIDFGSEHECTPQQLHKEIMYPDLPAFATKIRLSKVYPKTGKWLDSDYDYLLNTVTEFANINIVGPLNVEIPAADVYTDTNLYLNKALLDACPNLCKNIPETQEEDDVILIEQVETVDSTVQNSVNDETEHFNKEDKDQDDEEKKKSEDDHDDGEILTDYLIEKLPKKSCQEKNKMTIIAVLSHDTVVLNKVTSSTDDFCENFSWISDDIEQTVLKQPVVTNLEVGHPCVCPYSEDGVWYRARIHEIDALDCGYVFVFFVDFGNVESVSCKDLREMKPKWFKLPVYSHIAKVNIEPCKGAPIEHIYHFMKKLVGKNRLVEVLSEDPLLINLYDDDGQFAYQQIVDKGLVSVKGIEEK